eukprot:c21975_g1_i1 orf=508-1950(-)
MAALASFASLWGSVVSSSNSSTLHGWVIVNSDVLGLERKACDQQWATIAGFRTCCSFCQGGNGGTGKEFRLHGRDRCSWSVLFRSASGVKKDLVQRGNRARIRIRNDGHSTSEPTGRPGIDADRATEVISVVGSFSENGETLDVLDPFPKGELEPCIGGGGGIGDGGDNGKFGSGDGGDEDAKKNDSEEEEFGPLLNADEVYREVRERGIVLPPDMAEAARTLGMRSLLLSRYIHLQGAAWPLGAVIRGSRALRNRMLADQSFLFKVFTEIAIDAGCATFAEIQKRGKDFWNEFELYMADVLVGVVVDAALVGMLAPFVQFGQTASATGMMTKLSQTMQSLPSSVFEAEMPGRRYHLRQRVGTYFYKGAQYGAVGFVCGIVGQGIANSIMIAKRKLKKSAEKEIPVPPLLQSAALWGIFLAVSSNTRYQIINGLERLVEGSPTAKRCAPVAMAFTVGIRFANNIYGGMQFIDWARWAGVQ